MTIKLQECIMKDKIIELQQRDIFQIICNIIGDKKYGLDKLVTEFFDSTNSDPVLDDCMDLIEQVTDKIKKDPRCKKLVKKEMDRLEYITDHIDTQRKMGGEDGKVLILQRYVWLFFSLSVAFSLAGGLDRGTEPETEQKKRAPDKMFQ